MLIIRLILCSCFSFALGGALSPATVRAESPVDVFKPGAIRIAVPQDSPPFGMRGKYDRLEGYDISMAKIVALELGLHLDLVLVKSPERIPAVLERRADLIISSLGKNAEREKQINFTQAYAPFYLAVFGSGDVSVKAPADLAGKKIAVTRGSIEDTELSKIAPASTIIKRFDNTRDTVRSYLSGESTLLAVGNVVIATFSEEQAKNSLLKILLKDSPCYIGVHKSQPILLARVNALLSTIKQNGILSSSAQRWFKAPLPESILKEQ